jgi:hypothetical protein
MMQEDDDGPIIEPVTDPVERENLRKRVTRHKRLVAARVAKAMKHRPPALSASPTPRKLANTSSVAAPIYPSFGRMGYWHLIKEPALLSLNPGERADWLYKRLQSSWSKAGRKQKISPQILKAMALELVAHFGNGAPMPDSLLRSLAMMLELPETFLDDPVPVFTGKLAQGKHADPKARQAAANIDTLHFVNHGEKLSENGLSKKLQKLGLPIARSTLREWRKEKDYWEFAQHLFQRHAPSNKHGRENYALDVALTKRYREALAKKT